MHGLAEQTLRTTRAALLAAVVLGALVSTGGTGWAQEGVLLSENEAPRAVFPAADRFERGEIPLTDALRARVEQYLQPSKPSLWEPRYVTFSAWQGDTLLGRAFLVEEIGKHRPITFVVGVRADGHVQDVAVVAYREAYGGEIRNKRFLVQYRDKGTADSLQPNQAITNIAGATLSVEAASRAVKKALAVAQATAGGEDFDGGQRHAALAPQ